MLFRLLLTLAFIASSAFAQQPDTNTYSISGTVVNSVTGAPIRHALVQFHAPTSSAVLTTVDGSFQFHDLPAGEYRLFVRMPGSYSLLALRDGWNLKWRDPAVLKPFLAKAIPVTISRDSKLNLKIPVQ